MNRLGSEKAAVAAVIDPDVYVASTVTSGWVSLSDFEQAMAIIFAGTLGASATLDAKLEQATDSAGAGAKDVHATDFSITQMTQAGGDSDTQAVINVRGEQLDVDNNFNHIRLSMTIAVATSDCGGVVMGLNARYNPASDNDASTVAEIV